MKKMNGIIEHKPQLMKDQYMDEVAAALKKMKRQSPMLVSTSSRNDTIHRV